ncbi:Fanconi anemia group A protein homolog [Lycorma delicatula]|uniref:Fanconi anemia group A protein homolog n=1 Tax=Lycorma delicatula TaxID=130591 RepID=UPI003F519CAB
MMSFDDTELSFLSDTVEQQPTTNNQLKISVLSDDCNVISLSEICCSIKQQSGKNFDDWCLKVRDLVKLIHSCDSRFLIIREFFNLEKECLPVPLLWGLEVQDLFHFPVYLALRPNFISELAEELIDTLFSEGAMNKSAVIVLLRPTFVSAHLHDPVLGCPSEKFHSVFQKMYISRVLSNLNGRETDLILKLTKECGLLSKPLILFVKQMLRNVLLHINHTELLPTVTDAINKHSSWSYLKTPQHIIEFIKQLLDCLSVEDVFKLFQSLLVDDNRDLNLKWFLITVSTLIITNPDAGLVIKKTSDQWFKEAVVKRSKHSLGIVILLIRHCFAESVPPFISYASWYGSLDVHLDASHEFKFVFDFLSEMVPHEPSLYLKIHINKVPSAPVGAHEALSDYIMLAKTRLADLKESTDFIGLFGEYKTTEKEGRESDIARVLQHFKETGKVMKTILEAYVFRRNYYERVFLADLLQTVLDKKDPRYLFIEKLYALGKCPYAMYMDWVKRNENEKKLQEGLTVTRMMMDFSDDDWS